MPTTCVRGAMHYEGRWPAVNQTPPQLVAASSRFRPAAPVQAREAIVLPPRAAGEGDAMRDAQADVPSAGRLRAQLAFKDSMVHGILQFTPSIAFRYVLHRCESRDIRCRESLRFLVWGAAHRTGHGHGPALSLFVFLGAVRAGVCCRNVPHPGVGAVRPRGRRPPRASCA